MSVPNDVPPPSGTGTVMQSDATGPHVPMPSRFESPRETEGAGAVLAGKYTLLQEIGEGGMGTVYVAQQTEPVKRQVAVKLIKAGMDSRAVLARFEAERQALAVMDHPNIAKILDGGVAPSGVPFFVMELVKGVPITAYCDGKKLTPRERLELFVPVCQAIQHAHQKGIIHRDIKPSNILVATYDDRPVPKVIDFGIAKATGHSLTDNPMHTGLGGVVGTPQYMSPEQASLDGIDIDTRSDVYSLGILLYELLTGSPPFQKKELERAGFLEILRVVREEEPPKPSTKLSTADALPSLSAQRSTEPSTLTKILRNELDWIVMKALEKDRARRYESANGFAADVQRYLAGEAVLAHPPSKAYRLKKFLRKNRGPVLAASIVVFALVAGVIGTTFGLLRAEEQRKIAERNFQTSEENYQLARGTVDRYLTQVGDNRLLNEPYMDELRHELLNSAREFYQEFAERRRGDPAAAKDLALAHARLGDIAWNLGKLDGAIAEMEASRAAVPDRTEVGYIQAGIRLGSYRMQLGRFDAARAILDETLADAEARAKTNPEPESQNLIARVLELRGTVYRRKNEKTLAIADFTRGAEILEPLVKAHPSAQEHARDLSNIYVHRGQLAYDAQDDDEAEDWHRKSLAIRRRLAAANPDSTDAQAGLATSINGVAAVLRRKNRHADAIVLYQESIEILRKLVREHPEIAKYPSDLAAYLSNLSIVHKTSGGAERANELNRESLAILTGITRQFPTVTHYAYQLGVAESNEGNSSLDAAAWDDAIVWFDRSNATLAPLLKKSDDPRVRSVIRNNHWGRADAYAAKKMYAESLAAFDDTHTMAEERNRSEIQLARALVQARSGDHAGAIAAVDAITTAKTAKGSNWFDGAKVFAAAAIVVKADAPKAEGYRLRAVAALRKAFESGYFKNASMLRELKSRDLELLRDRTDFQQLVKEIESKFAESPKSKNGKQP
jgi:eukaryotic-like serine/threonine-protein kinase